MTRSAWLVAFLIIPLLSGQAGAAGAVTWIMDGESLTGATNVRVGERLFDVSFQDGSCIRLYDGCDSESDLPFPTAEEADLASLMLLSQVLTGEFDEVPRLTRGCDLSESFCFVFTPYWIDGGILGVSLLMNTADVAGDLRGDPIEHGLFDLPNYDTREDRQSTFAVWTLVPEPGSGVLVALGLLVWGLVGRLALGQAS